MRQAIYRFPPESTLLLFLRWPGRADYLGTVTGKITGHLLNDVHVGLLSRQKGHAPGWLAEPSVQEVGLQPARCDDAEHTDHFGIEGIGMGYAVGQENERTRAG